MLSFKNTGFSTPAYPAARLRFITITCFALQTRSTGMPAISLFGSSSAALLTVSFAPMTRATSEEGGRGRGLGRGQGIG